MRTVPEIIEYYQKYDDITGFAGDVLLPYMSAEEVRQFLPDDADLSGWQQKPLERDAVVAEMKDYMEFAWGKVQNHRGLSANRSVEKMSAWLWLLGDEETFAFAQDDAHYAQYGAPILKKICDVYGFPVPEGEGVVNMVQGKQCYVGCEEGCG